MKVILNPNLEERNLALEGLKAKTQKYGKPYCPCVAPSAHCEDTICKCREFREQVAAEVEGKCHCRLFLAEKE